MASRAYLAKRKVRKCSFKGGRVLKRRVPCIKGGRCFPIRDSLIAVRGPDRTLRAVSWLVLREPIKLGM